MWVGATSVAWARSRNRSEVGICSAKPAAKRASTSALM
ncbi:Uncharacterised protein [Mycobacteroides abscessus subsp. abscessus]|nr:Uncharacterised protein [Mycobacteroides abscessus subsp. abscessus]